LAMPSSVIVKTPRQYGTILEALKKLPWQADRHIFAEVPPGFGLTVAEEEGLGYRVRMLVIDHRQGLGLHDVVYREAAVARDGRLGIKTTTCIRAVDSGESVGKGPPRPRPANQAGYDQAIKAALKDDQSETIPNYFTATQTRAAMPRPINAAAGRYLTYDRWPEKQK